MLTSGNVATATMLIYFPTKCLKLLRKNNIDTKTRTTEITIQKPRTKNIIINVLRTENNNKMYQQKV